MHMHSKQYLHVDNALKIGRPFNECMSNVGSRGQFRFVGGPWHAANGKTTFAMLYFTRVYFNIKHVKHP